MATDCPKRSKGSKVGGSLCDRCDNQRGVPPLLIGSREFVVITVVTPEILHRIINYKTTELESVIVMLKPYSAFVTSGFTSSVTAALSFFLSASKTDAGKQNQTSLHGGTSKTARPGDSVKNQQNSAEQEKWCWNVEEEEEEEEVTIALLFFFIIFRKHKLEGKVRSSTQESSGAEAKLKGEKLSVDLSNETPEIKKNRAG